MCRSPGCVSQVLAHHILSSSHVSHYSQGGAILVHGRMAAVCEKMPLSPGRCSRVARLSGGIDGGRLTNVGPAHVITGAAHVITGAAHVIIGAAHVITGKASITGKVGITPASTAAPFTGRARLY